MAQSCATGVLILKREIPYHGDKVTDHIRNAYERYEQKRQTQIDAYASFEGPVYNGTLCKSLGCRRFFGRKGFCFCTEGCDNCDRKAGEPAPPVEIHDMDDEWDASRVMMEVLGPPPANVLIKRWRWDEVEQKYVLDSVGGGTRKDEAKNVSADVGIADSPGGGTSTDAAKDEPADEEIADSLGGRKSEEVAKDVSSADDEVVAVSMGRGAFSA